MVIFITVFHIWWSARPKLTLGIAMLHAFLKYCTALFVAAAVTSHPAVSTNYLVDLQSIYVLMHACKAFT